MTDWRKKYDKYQKKVSEVSDKVLVANWFLPEHIEGFLGKKITEKEYLVLIRKWHDSNGYDIISETIREWVNDDDLWEQIKSKLAE